MSLEAFLRMMRDFLPRGVFRANGLSDDVMAMMMEPWSTAEGKRALFRNFRRLNPEYTLAIGDQLRQLEHETLIIWGRQDPFQKPSYAEQLRAAIPNARLAWIENAAHWVMEEKPAQVAAELKAFLD
jgi:pimeloyl-ACP methyl ester carboxylesterase